MEATSSDKICRRLSFGQGVPPFTQVDRVQSQPVRGRRQSLPDIAGFSELYMACTLQRVATELLKIEPVQSTCRFQAHDHVGPDFVGTCSRLLRAMTADRRV